MNSNSFSYSVTSAGNGQGFQNISFLSDEGRNVLSLNPSSLCTIVGYIKVRGDALNWFNYNEVIPFRTHLTEAIDISRTEISHYENENLILKNIKDSQGTLIAASNFPTSNPLESISLQILKVKYENSGDVCLVQTSFTFKSETQLSNDLKCKSFDVIIDKVILFDGDVQLTKSISDIRNTPFHATPLKNAILLLSRGFEWNVYISMFLTASVFTILSLSASLLTVALVPLLFISFAGRGRLSNAVRAYLRTDCRKNMSFFVNGWQAWSFCGSVLHGSSPPTYAMPSVFARAFHDGGEGTSLPFNLGEDTGNVENSGSLSFGWRGISSKDFYMASDMFTALTDLDRNCGLVLGFLTQKLQFGCIAVNRDFDRIAVHISGDGVHAVPGSTLSTDWLALYTFDRDTIEEPFLQYMAMSRDANRAKVQQQRNLLNNSAVPVGWCSWYHFFANISEKDLMNNMQCMQRMKEKNNLRAERVGFNLFQVDDGYQNAWGDWATVNKATFPTQSLYNIVQKVKEENMVGGIWIAPFACDKHSEVAKNHKDWILRRKGSNVYANSGNCGKWFYGLDVTNEEVQEHVRKSIDVAINIWRFSYLKLDFLYASVLGGVQESYKDKTLTKAQILQIGMQLITESAGNDVFILGCGAPLGSVIGHVHANRISSDAGLSWYPEFPLPTGDKWNLPCARNMVRNSLCRMYMHGYWWINDPDCMLLRPSLHFSEEELVGIATVKAFSGGSFIISDDLDTITAKRFRMALQLLPPTNIAGVPLDLLRKEMPEQLRLKLPGNPLPSDLRGDNLISPWTMIALCNWDSKLNLKKSHVLSVRDIFGPQTVEEVATSLAPSASEGSLESQYFTVTMFLFSFWEESFRQIEITLDRLGPGSEVSFADIPHHSAHIYRAGLFDRPDSPYYIGSNLHFSCGMEVSAMVEIAATPDEIRTTLVNRLASLGHKKLPSEISIMQKSVAQSAATDLRPVLRSVHILFADGALRDAAWGGYIWLYLPFKFRLSAVDELQMMKMIEISGSASCAGAKLDESVIVVEIVRHGLSDVKGAVVKIPVGIKNDGYGNNVNRDLSIAWVYDVVMV